MVEVLERSGERVKIRCAFCEGTGKDPFGIPSHLSNCQVCLGKGVVWVAEPIEECAFCEGTGVHPGQRLTCTTCKGKGVVTIKGKWVECAFCEGSGVHRGTTLNCSCCGGKGKVAITEPYEKCTHCDGTGIDPAYLGYEAPCLVCKGKGVVPVKK